MGRVHALSGLLLVLMLLLMLHPKAVVIEEYGADGLGLSLGLLLAPGARPGAPMVFTLVSGVSLAMQGAAFFVDCLKNPKDF
jgi:hypothetical protein